MDKLVQGPKARNVVQLVRGHKGDVQSLDKDLVVFLGPSEVGKSMRINCLLGNRVEPRGRRIRDVVRVLD
jgi:GTP-binding protein EngB required for normal cell division